VALSKEKLEKSSLWIQSLATLENGQKIDLPDIRVPSKIHGLSAFQVSFIKGVSVNPYITDFLITFITQGVNYLGS